VARFFIDRPVFAIVISLFLLLIGTLSLVRLPVGEFPNIALPTVQVRYRFVPGEGVDLLARVRSLLAAGARPARAGA